LSAAKSNRWGGGEFLDEWVGENVVERCWYTELLVSLGVGIAFKGRPKKKKKLLMGYD